MAQSKRPAGSAKRVIAFSAWLYSLCLFIYPVSFRREYGSRIVHVFRDNCRDVLERQGLVVLIPFWLRALSDLFLNAFLEHWSVLQERIRSMATFNNGRTVPLRLWIALGVTILAFAVSLVASLNLYLIEDSSHLTQIAYEASPLLRFSYDGIYLSALAAGVAVCAIIGYALVKRAALVVPGLIVLALLVAFGGFGGLLVHHATAFLVDFIVFLAMTLLSLLVGRGVAARMARKLEQRPAGMFGACVSVCVILLINVIALVLHTLLLNPVSHALYMQGQIGGTHFNFSLIAMVLAFCTLMACVVSLGSALRLPSPRPLVETLSGNYFLRLQFDKHAGWITADRLDALFNLLCWNVFLDDWAGQFTHVLFDNLSLSIGCDILVGFDIVNNQSNGWIPFEI